MTLMSLPSSWLRKLPIGGYKKSPRKRHCTPQLPIVSKHFNQIRSCLKKLIKTSENSFLPTKHEKKHQRTQPVDATRTRHCSCETPFFFFFLQAQTHLHFLLWYEAKCVIFCFSNPLSVIPRLTSVVRFHI